MKSHRHYLSFLLLLGISSVSHAQQPDEYHHQLRLSLDEDFINIRGQGTDRAYTAGTFIDYRYSHKYPGFFLERWAPKAGSNATNIYGVGLVHLMFTPNNTSLEQPINNDFPYAGAVLAHFSSWSYNAGKKYAIHSRFMAGMLGEASGAREIQEFVHRLTGTQQPKGWDNQLPNDILINIDVTAEKQIFGLGWTDLIGAGRAYAGSMTNALEASLLLRTGKMKSWFSGLMAHSSTPPKTSAKGRWQAYLFARPAVQFIAYNALLQGGIILKKEKKISPDINRLTATFDYGLMLSHGNFGISFTQKVFSPWIKGLSSHEVGNITLYFNW